MPEPTETTDITSNWIADGTSTAEPQTVETPAEPAVVRDDRGRFAPKPDAIETTAHTDTPTGTAVESPAPSVQAVQEFIDAQLGENETFKVPKGIRIPLKRGNDVEYVPLEDLQKNGMFERDYRIKTAEVARVRKEAEALQTRLSAESARVKAREDWLAERESEMVDAQKDPAKWAAYTQMQELYRTNPTFRKTLDDALAKRETDAENAVYREQEHREVVEHGAEVAAGWITQIAQEPAFRGVSPDRVRQLYATALTSGQARLDPQEVRTLFQQEAQFLASSQGPLQSELATLKARLAAIEAAKGAEKHNATTTHALNRAKTPPVATGAAPIPGKTLPQGKFGPRELVERNQAWASQRD